MDATPLLIEGRVHDLGDGFRVRRLLPELAARHIGPFVFFDHMGPSTLPAGRGMDVRPHPHIGLATVTWLFDGAIRHRDSLGSAVDIRPGAVNWMTAGRGIVHSERTPPAEREHGHTLHGVQVWVALPQADEETAPEFHHHEAAALPQLGRGGAALTLIAGTAYGAASPVKVFAPMFFIEARLPAGTTLDWPTEHPERGVHVIEGELRWGELAVPPGRMAVQRSEVTAPLHALSDARVMLFGGAPLDGERRLWWNFVSSRAERIEQAKADWREGRFERVPGDADEFIPLPDR